jgi:DUSAM domain-containing protein
MKSTSSTFVVGLAVLLGLFAAGAAAALCQPGETSVSCCIRKFPLSPVENCAATEAEALKVLSGLKLAYEAARATEGKVDDFANNSQLPNGSRNASTTTRPVRPSRIGLALVMTASDAARGNSGGHSPCVRHARATRGENLEGLDADWNQVWELNQRVQRSETVELTEEVRELLRRAGPTVALSSTEIAMALASEESAAALIHRIDARVHDGSRRLSAALNRMYRLRDSGDVEGARQQMRGVLAVEVVPHYRDIAEGQLERLDELP